MSILLPFVSKIVRIPPVFSIFLEPFFLCLTDFSISLRFLKFSESVASEMAEVTSEKVLALF